MYDTSGKQWEQYQTADNFKWNEEKIYHLKLYYPKVFKGNNENFSDWRFFPFATGVNDTDTGGAPWVANISANFRKIWNGPNGIIRGLKETDPCRKPEVESLVTLSFASSIYTIRFNGTWFCYQIFHSILRVGISICIIHLITGSLPRWRSI